MDKSRTISSDEKNRRASKSLDSKNKSVNNILSDHISSKSLKQRYVDLWRSRFKQKGKKIFDGFLISYLVGAIIILYSSYVLSTVPFLLTSSMLFVIGSIIGASLAGYIYEFDGFLGFHIGVIGSIPMILLFSSILLLNNPMSLLYIIPMLLLNTIMSGIGTYIYSSIGYNQKQSQK